MGELQKRHNSRLYQQAAVLYTAQDFLKTHIPVLNRQGKEIPVSYILANTRTSQCISNLIKETVDLHESFRFKFFYPYSRFASGRFYTISGLLLVRDVPFESAIFLYFQIPPCFKDVPALSQYTEVDISIATSQI